MSTRIVVMGERGDMDAPPGSRDWAIAVRAQIQASLHDVEFSATSLNDWVKGMERYQGYQNLTDQKGTPFTSFAAFCKERQPFGLGYPPEVIERLIGERTSAQSNRERMRAAVDTTTGEILPRGGDQKSEAISMSKCDIDPQATRAADKGISRYQQIKLDRLARDFPEHYAEVKAGTISPHAAAVKVGIVKATMTVPFDPTEAARYILRRYTPDQFATFYAALVGGD